MAFRRSGYLSRPTFWADDSFPTREVNAEVVRLGMVFVFGGGNAYLVNSVDKIDLLHDSRSLYRYNCTGGATAAAWHGDVVSVVDQDREQRGING